MQSVSHCNLCGSVDISFYHSDKRRDYWQCRQCDLVFVDKHQHLTPTQEKAIYDSHENSLEDLGYKQFLSRVSDPLLRRLRVPSSGLDFGCGPGPLLAKVLSDAGHSMAIYDLYYANDITVLRDKYDFITCTEVIEHLAHPQTVLTQLFSLLKPEAPLVIMTKLVINAERFTNWHYKNDQTHISFFSRKTFEYIALQFNCKLEFIGNDVIILTKPITQHALSEELS
ncbi:class I SAM-dependent methyltransferase [Pseudoalteromonas sp. MMG012]|uniref:class I SAM-dependent methyltransferase n=1 Tax=Pseudoalteromonas sp. MMG012 TaxID=2822686 RepID=UPI001B39E2CF|nr:class I SAM-dependent methyltransferase [Pseudoalteromonas sp. MMG012]MBQ4850144.1 class I SAM-dependent methyltransferase [Pseudoalteromonas sp. MMG012]